MAAVTRPEDANCARSPTCAVCLADEQDPRLLRCLHSFCRVCVEDMSMRNGWAQKLECPVCRMLTDLPTDGVDGLPKDVTRCFAQTAECESCKEEGARNEAEGKCLTCGVLLCREHGMAHPWSNNGHAVTALPKDSDVTTSARQVCSQHNERLKYFCKRCDVCVCPDCVVVGPHRGHGPVFSVAEITADLSQRVFGKSAKLRALLTTTENGLSDVKSTSAKLAAAAERVRTEVRSAEKHAIAVIHAIAQQKLLEVDDIEQLRSKVLDAQQEDLDRHAERLRSTIAFLDRLLAKKITIECWASLLAVEKRVEELTRVPVASTAAVHDRVAFVSADREAVGAKATEMLGDVLACNASPVRTCAKGGSSSACSTNTPVRFVLVAKDDHNKPLTEGGDKITVAWTDIPPALRQHPPRVEVTDENDGAYQVSFTPRVVGRYSLQVLANGHRLQPALSVTCHSSEVHGMTFDTTACQPGITVSADKRSATHTGRNSCSFVLGNRGMSRGQHSWAVRVVKSLRMNVILGVAKKNCLTVTTENENLTYGFAGYGSKKAPAKQKGESMKWHVNDLLRLELDCERHVLAILNTRSGEKDSIAELPSDELYPYFHLCHENDSIALVRLV